MATFRLFTRSKKTSSMVYCRFRAGKDFDKTLRTGILSDNEDELYKFYEYISDNVLKGVSNIDVKRIDFEGVVNYFHNMDVLSWLNKEIKKRERTKVNKTGKTPSYSTRMAYWITYENIKEFCDRSIIYPHNINELFYKEFKEFLELKGLSKGTIALRIAIIKIFLNDATDRHVLKNTKFRRYAWEEGEYIDKIS